MTGLHQALASMLLLPILLAGCSAPATPPPVDDVTDQRVLLVGYSPNADVRRMFEDRLQEALLGHDVNAMQSHLSIPSFAALEHAAILAAADAGEAGLILMVRRLAVDDDRYAGDIPEQPQRGMRAYRTLQDFLASYDQRPATPPPPSRQVVEVYGYTRDGAGARLIWSGFSWVDFDGDLERAIGETAKLIASNMAQSRDAVRATIGGAP
ncbi:MAG: hypothetical protein JJT88_02890 [Gammaproteobacteria bacterium]|nr:hypothetical protein [Gammaproteobacteria bacterium]